MPYIVTEPCIKCKYTDCVAVCPVECFHEGENMLAIDPEECIDCGACVPECPVEAIFMEADLPEKWSHFVEINARLSQKWPQISDKQPPLPTADKYSKMKKKEHLLSEKPA